MKKTSFLVLTCFLFSTVIMAQSKEEKEVAALVETMRKAMVDADKSALEKIAADELSYGHSSGLIEDKATFVGSLVSGKFDFVTIELTEQTIKIANNVALVRHKLKGETNNEGKPGTANIGVLLIWQKQQGGWKLLARQAFKL